MDDTKYSPVIAKHYDRDVHMQIDEAFDLIKNTKSLDGDLLKGAVDNKDIFIYDFKGEKYLDRLDVGRIFHNYKEEKEGMTVTRYFTNSDEDPFESVNYNKKDLSIKDFKSKKTIFEIKDAEIPEWMDDVSAQIVAHKYFFTPEKREWKEKLENSLGRDHEFSLKHLGKRVADFFTDKGDELGYFKTPEDVENFRNELYFLQINGMMAFNSPVQFNAGLFNSYGIDGTPGIHYIKDSETGEVKRIEEGEYIHPQLHACFIKGPQDGLESILEHSLDEGAVFAAGSGIGQDIGKLREEGGKLSGGGAASGPLSFLKNYDTGAGTIKSGGKTRRAARMTTMKQTHPDILKFIRAKVNEDKKAWTLIKAGYDTQEAYDTVALQNTNLSVRLDNYFFEQIEKGGDIELYSVKEGNLVKTINAEEMLKEISFGSWRIGDPAVQYDSKIQEMHTIKNSGEQSSSNPCSEYLGPPKTSCNLLSLNLPLFMKKDGTFDTPGFQNAIRIAVIAQDIANDVASSPIKEIARISPEFRTIGTGDLGLGSYLMQKGISYDSEKGRAFRGAIASILTSTAYEVSAELADKLEPFVHFEFNREPMLEVMKKHKKSLEDIDWDLVEDKGLKEACHDSWESVLEKGAEHGFRNSQTTVLAPTGTISYLMGSPTTGTEPAISLRITKNLAGGGHVVLVNKDVHAGLESLKYDPSQIEIIENFITENNTARGAPILKPEHYKVFDTALGNAQGKGSIGFEGHLKMVAAAQPFISGAISKTNNLPENATLKDVYDGYILGQKLGLKAVSIFRNNSKPISALSFGDQNHSDLKRGEKEDLPSRGESFRNEIKINGTPFLINIGEFKDGRPGEIVINSYTSGSTLGNILRTAGVGASKSLKRGVGIEFVTSGWIGQEFEPSGLVSGHPYIKTASSPLDFAGKLAMLEYKGIKDFANDPDSVDLKILRGATHGAFKAYHKKSVDQWDIEQILKDPFLGGFVEKSEEDLLLESNGNLKVSDKGRICNGCGSVMIPDSPNCYHCDNCGDKIGGCGA